MLRFIAALFMHPCAGYFKLAPEGQNEFVLALRPTGELFYATMEEITRDRLDFSIMETEHGYLKTATSNRLCGQSLENGVTKIYGCKYSTYRNEWILLHDDDEEDRVQISNSARTQCIGYSGLTSADGTRDVKIVPCNGAATHFKIIAPYIGYPVRRATPTGSL
ncbi:hypothetical protein PAPHI01_0613 [Pancytospora philotis]|nr:hypothetical protein PAPHI01_0613 [Pancytospora philotis]